MVESTSSAGPSKALLLVLVLATSVLLAGDLSPDIEAASKATASRYRNALENLYGVNRLQVVRITTRASGKAGEVLLAQMIRSAPGLGRSRIIVRLVEPPRLRGTAVLLNRGPESERTAYIYLPAVGATRRVVSEGLGGELLFGTDLAMADLDVPFAGAFVIARPKHGLSSCPSAHSFFPSEATDNDYDSVVGCLSETMTVLKWLDFRFNGETRKLLRLDQSSVQKMGNRFIAMRMHLENPSRSSITDLEVSYLAELTEIPDSVFGVGNLARGSAERDRGGVLKYVVHEFGSLDLAP